MSGSGHLDGHPQPGYRMYRVVALPDRRNVCSAFDDRTPDHADAMQPMLTHDTCRQIASDSMSLTYAGYAQLPGPIKEAWALVTSPLLVLCLVVKPAEL